MPELPWTVLVLNSGPFSSQLLHEGLVLTRHLSHTWKFQLRVGQGRIAMSLRLACVVVPQRKEDAALHPTAGPSPVLLIPRLSKAKWHHSISHSCHPP